MNLLLVEFIESLSTVGFLLTKCKDPVSRRDETDADLLKLITVHSAKEEHYGSKAADL